MLKSYITIALRQLKKQQMYSLIKIGGFALSIAACLLIALYIKDELSYDRQYPHSDRLYRVINVYKGDDVGRGTDFPAPFSKVLMTDFPQVEKAGNLMANPLFYGAGSNEVKAENQVENTYEEGFTYADQGFMDAIGAPVVYGNPTHLLDEPNTIVITRRKADKYFPRQNPVGKVLYLNNDRTHPYKISGVIADTRSSALQFDFYLTLKNVVLFPGESDYWGANNHETYVLLKPGADPQTFVHRMRDHIVTKYMIPNMLDAGNKNAVEDSKKLDLELQPISDIYLKSYDIGDDLPSHGDIRFVWMFGGIAAFILVIACINFINLSTARSANRAKEVGLRKVVGSNRSSLIQQFLAESLVYSLFSFILAVVLAWAILPWFNRLADKSLTMPWGQWWLFPVMLISAFVIGIAAGLYPAFYLSNFKPIKVLKGEVSRGSRNNMLRSVLVVFQFTTSIILIIGTFVIYRQMQYILHRKVGFDKDQVLLIQGTNTLSDSKTFKDELSKLAQVKSVSISDFLPISGGKRNGNAFYHFKDGNATTDNASDAPYYAQYWTTDYDYIPTMGMHLIEGRNFSKDMTSDSAAVIISQTFAKKMGLGPHPVGHTIKHFGTPMHIIGMVEDFNYESMRWQIEGVCLSLGVSPSVISVKMNTADVGTLIPEVTTLWKRFAPDQPIRYTFLDERFKSMYADVQRQGSIFTSFAVLAIIIACLGLFALSAFMAEQRTKEVSIRKVLGATATQLVAMMSRDFVMLVLIAFLIATPVAWWGMQHWLQNFVFRIELHWPVFALAGLLVQAIALATISFQAVKTAIMNPVKGLRSE
ncbi:ABC transporter permease [Puia dinghuensis]|uniref:ABC transporter permease n=1 Tax=Puia dinghuensis TaxID=1792502 RepID=A0A8J2U7W1_9BACT|nr:ABC transporter permease [Puia dinghuensis]GGA84908.1 ABC transporter permease [Puia dinghuensis]